MHSKFSLPAIISKAKSSLLHSRNHSLFQSLGTLYRFPLFPNPTWMCQLIGTEDLSITFYKYIFLSRSVLLTLTSFKMCPFLPATIAKVNLPCYTPEFVPCFDPWAHSIISHYSQILLESVNSLTQFCTCLNHSIPQPSNLASLFRLCGTCQRCRWQNCSWCHFAPKFIPIYTEGRDYTEIWNL